MRAGRHAAALALLLAGCESAVETAADARNTLDYRDCAEQTALMLAPASALPALPEGFAYTTPAGDVGVAAVHISGARCTGADDGSETHEVLAFALAAVPERYRDPDIATYAIALGGYSNRLRTVRQFEAWGLTGLIEHAEVRVRSTDSPLTRIGEVDAVGRSGTLATRMTAAGPSAVAEPGGGHTRAYYVRDGRVVAAVEALYSEQTAMAATGTVSQTGAGPLPLAGQAVIGTHAFGYTLHISSPPLP